MCSLLLCVKQKTMCSRLLCVKQNTIFCLFLGYYNTVSSDRVLLMMPVGISGAS